MTTSEKITITPFILGLICIGLNIVMGLKTNLLSNFWGLTLWLAMFFLATGFSLCAYFSLIEDRMPFGSKGSKSISYMVEVFSIITIAGFFWSLVVGVAILEVFFPKT